MQLGLRRDACSIQGAARFPISWGGVILPMVCILSLLAALLLPQAACAAMTETALWYALRSPGHVAVIRHALAPGTGDPPGFRIDDCETQRNLSEAGRQQARRIGDLFRKHGIRSARVYTSQWCRCRETAQLLDLGGVQDLPLLNSFFSRPELGDARDRALRDWIARQTTPDLVILITHQVNITALSAIYPAVGEIVVLRQARNGQLRVLGSIPTE